MGTCEQNIQWMEAERVEFEKEMRATHGEIDLSRDSLLDYYKHDGVDWAWNAWQARAEKER